MKVSNFAERLIQALQIKKMSAAELSRKTGVAEGTISNYKKGVYEAKQDRVLEFSKALNVNPAWLMGYDVPIQDESAHTPGYSHIKNVMPVCIRIQPDVDDGQIAAVLIGEEATLKRVYHRPNGITLMAENPAFPPMVYIGEECEDIRIMGKAITCVSKVR